MQHKADLARRSLLLGIAAAVPITAEAQEAPYPSRPIRVLVGSPPGGSTDSLARMFADWLRQSTGQPVVVENRTGAGGAIAADAAARAAADGYTLLAANDALLTVPLLQRLSFDPLRDFAPIGTIGVNRFVLVVHPSVPATTLAELVALARARPGQLSHGSSGTGALSHIGMERFKMLTRTDMVHVPFRGAGPALIDGIAGRYQVAIWTPLAVSAHVAAGRLRALAVTGPARLSLMPDIPTFAEAGLPEFDKTAWFAIFAPSGTPGAIVDRLGNELQLMLAAPTIREIMSRQGVEPFISTPAEMTAMLRADTEEFRRIIQAAAIRMD